MLRGMGWRGPGDAVGGSNKADVQPVQFKRRGERSGLGADQDNGTGPLPHLDREEATKGEEKKDRGTSREESAGAVLRAKAGSRVLPLHSQQLRVDALVSVVGGRHRRRYGRVKGLSERKSSGSKEEGSEKVYWCDVLVNGDERTVEIDSRDLEVLDEKALPRDHPAFTVPRPAQKTEEERKEAEPVDRTVKRQKTEGEEHHKAKASHDSLQSKAAASHRPSSSSSPPTSNRVRWCRSHLRVRLISRSYARGAHYRGKGVVTDVADASHISVRLDGDPRVLEGLREEELETVIPSVHGRVMVVRGEHSGEVGELLVKDAERDKATVQLEAELTVLQLSFDDVCECQ